MNCFYHPSRPAVAHCPDCGKGLCSECAAKFEKPICPECNGKRGKNDLRKYSKPLIICAIMFIVGCFVGKGVTNEPFLTGYVFTCIYGGWSIAGTFFNNILITLDKESILLYYGLKIVLAAVVGIFATPVYLCYCIYKLIRTVTI